MEKIATKSKTKTNFTSTIASRPAIAKQCRTCEKVTLYRWAARTYLAAKTVGYSTVNVWLSYTFFSVYKIPSASSTATSLFYLWKWKFVQKIFSKNEYFIFLRITLTNAYKIALISKYSFGNSFNLEINSSFNDIIQPRIFHFVSSVLVSSVFPFLFPRYNWSNGGIGTKIQTHRIMLSVKKFVNQKLFLPKFIFAYSRDKLEILHTPCNIDWSTSWPTDWMWMRHHCFCCAARQFCVSTIRWVALESWWPSHSYAYHKMALWSLELDTWLTHMVDTCWSWATFAQVDRQWSVVENPFYTMQHFV